MDLKCYAHIIYTDHPTDERRKRTTATKRWRLTPPGGQIFEMLMDVLTTNGILSECSLTLNRTVSTVLQYMMY